MKTMHWILLFLALALACTGVITLLSLTREPASCATVSADGIVLLTIDLEVDGDYRVESAEGWNLLRVENGRLAVVDASCGNHDCVRQGASNSGAPIVCLPNHLVIEFSSPAVYDAMLG